MATQLGNAFSTAENQVSQCDDQTIGPIAETLVIHFDQERFEQLLSGGQQKSSTCVQAQGGKHS